MLRFIAYISLCIFCITHLTEATCPAIVSRNDWDAAAPKNRQTLTSLPVPYVIIHHTYLPGACNTSNSCKAAMRSMQNFHQNTNQWDDIGYHFCIGGTGKVYEGRGWDVLGTHAPNYNGRSVGICFIGDFRNELPTSQMLAAAKSLIKCGVQRGSISSEYKLLGHRQVRETECPGKTLFNEIKTWPHWNSLNNTMETIKTFHGEHWYYHKKDVAMHSYNCSYAAPLNYVSNCSEVVSRVDWNATTPVSTVVLTSLPVPYVVIHHTYQPGFCNTSEACKVTMRTIQNYHKNVNHWTDIGYQFCIGGTGKVYEGRGWNVLGSHALNYNSRSVGICFIGDFRNELPTPQMLAAAKSLIECGVQRGSISPEYKLLGHRQVRDTECPGETLMNEIKTWPHWNSLNNTSEHLNHTSSQPTN